MTKFWARTTKFDVLSNLDGAVVARNVTAAEAATLLGGGVTADAVTYAISNFSFLDTGDYRVAGHGQISGGTL